MFWVVPAVGVAASVGLALGLVILDQRLGRVSDVFLYPGPPSGARSLLSSIVTAMITFTGMVFSVSIVVLQLTNGQFSSRIVRIYLRDLTVQITLALFLATFVYSMVVLRAVKGGDGQAHFVPRIAVTVSLALVVASVGTFIRYISHIANMVRVATIVSVIGKETTRLADDLVTVSLRKGQTGAPPAGRCPAASPGSGGGVMGPAEPVLHVPAPRSGVLVSLNEELLVTLAAELRIVVVVLVRVGDFLPKGAPLYEVRATAGTFAESRWQAKAAQVIRAAALDTERTMEQDLAFGFRQLVDIAERALSPAVNDPTTASQCLDVLHDLLRRLAPHRLPDGLVRDDQGDVRLVVRQYSFADYLEVALAEIWHYGAGSAQIPGRVATLLDDLALVARVEHRDAIQRWRLRIADYAATPVPTDDGWSGHQR